MVIPRIVRADDGAQANNGDDDEDLDERRRQQYLVVLQFLQERSLFDSLAALERETGVHYNDGDLPAVSMLEGSLDMFARYRVETEIATVDEEELQAVERGVCCTGPFPAGDQAVSLSANVTALAWASAEHEELLALVATADKCLRLVGPDGQVLAESTALPSPVLGLDVSQNTQEALATTMGGETLLFQLNRPNIDGALSLELKQSFKDHMKHVSSGRFAPAEENSSENGDRKKEPLAFVTVSRDHQAKLYNRENSTDNVCKFVLVDTVKLAGEVTCCCWVSHETFVLAARDDHNLHYWDTASGPNGTPARRMKANLNVLGDSVVSFAVLALAVSPDRRLLAACTDKSRIIVMRTFTEKQLRNLYGATVDEYDMPSVCFSLDQSFLYATSSLPQRTIRQDSGDEVVVNDMCGEVVIFELRSGEPVLKLPCHRKAVRCMARHPLSEHLVTGSFDKTVRFWS